MVKMAIRLLAITAALYLGGKHIDGIVLEHETYGYPVSFITLVFVFIVIEVIIHPLLNLVILPLRMIIFGIASIILSVTLVYFISLIVPLFEVTFWGAVLLGFVIGIIRSLTK